jgi:hypothetical protein
MDSWGISLFWSKILIVLAHFVLDSRGSNPKKIGFFGLDLDEKPSTQKNQKNQNPNPKKNPYIQKSKPKKNPKIHEV